MLPHFSPATYLVLGEFCGAVYCFRGCTYYASINLLLDNRGSEKPPCTVYEEARSVASSERTGTIKNLGNLKCNIGIA